MAAKREVCKACGRINRVGFTVPDEIWEAVVPTQYRNSVICLTCFTEWADDTMLPWDEHIDFYPVSLSTFWADGHSGEV